MRPLTGGLEFPINAQETNINQSLQQQQSRQFACRLARIADDYRGKETLVLDMTQITPIFDYFVLTTANNSRQMRAMADEIDRFVKQEGFQRVGREGRDGTTWILLDYGDVVVHVFTPDTRQMYDLENLWADAGHVDWQAEPFPAST